MSSFDLSVLKWSATASIPLWFGIFVYNELTSSVTKRAPSGMCPSCLSLLMKCSVSLTYQLVLGTYFFIIMFINIFAYV